MDLSTLSPTSDTITIVLKHPITGDPLTKDDGKEMTVTVFAPHSREYKAAIYAQANKRILKAQKSKKITMTAEEIEQSSLDLLVQTTKDFNLQMNGKTVKFSVAEAMEIYQKFPWIKDQVVEGQEDYTNFLKD